MAKIKKKGMITIDLQKIDYSRYGNLYVTNGGFSIIPVNSREKKGSLIPGWKEYQKRIPDEKDLEEWTEKFPDGGLAVVTGKISNVIVLDIDPGHGGMETIKGKNIPKTITVETGGGGYHYYYLYPEIDGLETIKNFVGDNVNLPGVDLRADGGMVYAPPSLHPTGNVYKFEDGKAPTQIDLAEPPEWLLEVIRKNQKEKSRSLVEKKGNWEIADQGKRNDTCTSYAGKLLRANVPLDIAVDTLLSWNQNNPSPLSEREIVNTAEGVYERYENESDKFIPTKVAELLKEHLRLQMQQYWIHIPKTQQDYRYNINEGYFVKESDEYLKKIIRDLIVAINPEWESDSKIKEVYSAYCHLMQKKILAKRLLSAKGHDELVNLQNGMLKWETGKLRDHSPKYLSLYQLPVKYDPKAKCSLWKQTLKEWLPDQKTRKFLQEYVGYCLIPDTTQHKALILLGQGANGKTTFLEVIRELFGEDNMTSIPLHRLGERFETSKLQHSLVNVCDDIDPVYMKKTGTIKTIISGGKLRAEEKHKPSYEFRPVTRLIFAANEIPTVKDKSDGWYRRFEIIKFEQKFKAGSVNWDPNLKEKLVKEIPGIFSWALKGLKRLKTQGTFTRSEKISKANAEYRETNDSVEAFVADKVRKREDKPEFVYPKKVVYEKYKSYCETNNLRAVSRKKMSARLAGSEMEFKTGKRRKHRYNMKQEKTNDIFPDFEPSIEEVTCQNESYEKKKSVRCFIGIEVLKEY